MIALLLFVLLGPPVLFSLAVLVESVRDRHRPVGRLGPPQEWLP